MLQWYPGLSFYFIHFQCKSCQKSQTISSHFKNLFLLFQNGSFRFCLGICLQFICLNIYDNHSKQALNLTFRPKTIPRWNADIKLLISEDVMFTISLWWCVVAEWLKEHRAQFYRAAKAQKDAKHNNIVLTRIRLPAKLPCHMYHLWLVSC